eukprot:1394903-Prorocentrum_lima.AAC.1
MECAGLGYAVRVCVRVRVCVFVTTLAHKMVPKGTAMHPNAMPSHPNQLQQASTFSHACNSKLLTPCSSSSQKAAQTTTKLI